MGSITKNKLFKKEILILLVLCILALLPRLWLLFNSDNLREEGHSWDCVHLTQYWLDNPYPESTNRIPNLSIPYLICHGVFPPMKYYLIGLSLKIWDNPLISPRLMCLIFGLLTLFPFYYYLKPIFGKDIALFSTFLLSISPNHIVYSAESTEAIPFIFFLFCSFCLFFNSKWILSAIFLNLACASRLEGVLFIPALTFFLLKEKKIREGWLFLSISMIFPIFWMIGNWWEEGNPLYSFIAAGVINRSEDFPPLLINPNVGWLIMLIRTLTFPVAILGFIGVVYSFIKKKYLKPAILFLILFLSFSGATILRILTPRAKYSLSLDLLLIPYAVLGLYLFLKIFNKKWKKVVMAFFILLVFYLSILHISADTDLNYRRLIPEAPKDVASWLKGHVAPDEKILYVAVWDFDYDMYIIVSSGIRPGQFLRIPPGELGLRWEDGIWKIDKDYILRLLKSEEVTYIIFAPGSPLLSMFHFTFDNDIESEYGYLFKLVYRTPSNKDSGKISCNSPKEPYRIYKLCTP